MKPCPFCRSNEINLHYPDEHGHYVCWCGNCGAFGPNDISEAKAREMWNLRRPTDKLVAVCQELLANGTEWDGEADGQHWEQISVKREVIKQARAAIAAARPETEPVEEVG